PRRFEPGFVRSQTLQTLASVSVSLPPPVGVRHPDLAKADGNVALSDVAQAVCGRNPSEAFRRKRGFVEDMWREKRIGQSLGKRIDPNKECHQIGKRRIRKKVFRKQAGVEFQAARSALRLGAVDAFELPN